MVGLVGRGSAHAVFLHPGHEDKVVRVSLEPIARFPENVLAIKSHLELLRPILGEQYVPESSCCRLSEAVSMAADHLLAKKSPNSPKCTAHSDVTALGTNHSEAWGLATANFMRIWLPWPLRNPPSHGSITIEIKPKLSLEVAARSKLVGCGSSFQNDIKFAFSRFSMTQVHKLNGTHGTCRTGSVLRQSYFEPADLYQSSLAAGQGPLARAEMGRRTRQALSALLAEPQNNLRVFVNGRALEWASGGAEAEELAAALGAAFPAATGCPAATGDSQNVLELRMRWLLEQVARVLEREPILAGLAETQKRDILDVEGAGLVFERLVDLHQLAGMLNSRTTLPTSKFATSKFAKFAEPSGTREQLECAAVAAMSEDVPGHEREADSTKSETSLGRSCVRDEAVAAALKEIDAALSPVSPSHGAGVVGGRQGESDGANGARGSTSVPTSLPTSLPVSLPTPPSAEERALLGWDASLPRPGPAERAAAVALVARLDQSACVRLLANSLLALAAADASVMLTFTAATAAATEAATEAAAYQSTDGRSAVLQRCDSAGVLELEALPDAAQGERSVLVYCIGLTDIGPKPSSKIPSRALKEASFCELVTEVVAKGPWPKGHQVAEVMSERARRQGI